MRTFVAALLVCFGTAQADSGLTIEGPLPDGPSYTAYLVSYPSDELKVHAMVAVPRSERPGAGFPIVVANHGYVPDPRQYGIGADGLDSRPGDYYRSVPDLYASRGFVVVMPDYRGHNSSEGYEQIKGQDRAAMQEIVGLYAADVAALLGHLGQIQEADSSQVFMWSHSMGGGVSMRVILASDVVKAASFWSTMDISDMGDRLGDISTPIMIHHARGDRSTTSNNSIRLAAALASADKIAELNIYDVAEHFFGQELREAAADRDAAFFLSR